MDSDEKPSYESPTSAPIHVKSEVMSIICELLLLSLHLMDQLRATSFTYGGENFLAPFDCAGDFWSRGIMDLDMSTQVPL